LIFLRETACLDIYLAGGKRRIKEFVNRRSLEKALTVAIQDIRSNWQKYKVAFWEMDDGKENI